MSMNIHANKSVSAGWPALLAALSISFAGAGFAEEPVRGTDELFWVPTLQQALDMAGTTGQPIFIMGYSLVGDGSTYTKQGANFCSGVF
jgi:hypothetical protein